MSKISYSQTNFNAGELSPRFKGRTDHERYKSGLATCENAIVLPHGGLTRRPGFQYINEVKDSSKLVELIPFEFSEDQAYVLEFGDLYMRVFMDGGRVSSPDAYTDLLLHCDGSDGSIYFLDSGYNEFDVTANGSVQVDTGQYKFASGSALFDGDGDYLSIPDNVCFSGGTGVLTLDFWVRFDEVTGVHSLYYQTDTTVTDYVAVLMDHEMGKLCIAVRDTTSVMVHKKAWAPVADTWYHVAIIRGWGSVTDTWCICINGTSIDTWTGAVTMPNLDGTVRIGGGIATTVEIDVGLVGNAVTLAGGAVIDNNQSKFGNGSLELDGTDDYAQIPDSANWNVATSTNYTIDMFVKFGDHVGTETLIGQYEDGDNLWELKHTHGAGLNFRIRSAAADIVTLTGGEVADTNWHHVAVCKVGNDYGIYLDGTQTAFVNDADTDTYAGDLYIGSLGATTNWFYGYVADLKIHNSNFYTAAPVVGLTDTITVPTSRADGSGTSSEKLVLTFDHKDFDGWLDEYRWSKGRARWTANFTAPTTEYPGAGGGTTCEIVTPYSEADVENLRYVQSADTMYLFHPSHNVYKLTREDHDVWNIEEIDWNEPPWNDMNTDAAHTLDPSATTGNITVVANWDFFSPLHIGAYFKQANGFYRITAVTDSNTASATVKDDLDNHNASADWYQGAWDDSQGYPTCGVFHEDRLILAGVELNPLTLYISKVGDYEDFSQAGTPVDDDGLTVTIWSQQQNRIKWLQSAKRLFVGTVGSEFWVSGATVETPIAPDSIQAKPETRIGGEGISPVMVDNSVIFVQSGGEHLRLWTYEYESDGYSSSDISIIAEHLMAGNPVYRLQQSLTPTQVIWATTYDGTLLGLTLVKEQKVIGWHKHTTGVSDTIESIAVIPGDTQDEVWVVVARDIDGSTKRYVERMGMDFYQDDIEDAFFVDSGLSYDDVPAVNFSGMDHLEGMTVQVLADGEYIGTKTISSGGFTLDTAASVVHAGLAYNTNIETLPWNLSTDTSTDTVKKRIVAVLLKLLETSEVKTGKDSSNLISIPMTDGALHTDWYQREHNGDFEYHPTIYIRQDEPLPLTLLSITADIEMGGR